MLEAITVPKSSQKPNEDAYVVTDDYVAVIDGSTAKSRYHQSPRRSVWLQMDTNVCSTALSKQSRSCATLSKKTR